MYFQKVDRPFLYHLATTRPAHERWRGHYGLLGGSIPIACIACFTTI
jgi:hypothetical protein